MSELALIWCPCPDQSVADLLVRCLLDEGLIACGNILPAIRSHFIWQGERDTAQEVGVIMKTRTDMLQDACDRAAQLHQYDEPVVVGWVASAAPDITSAWIDTALAQGPAK